MYSKVCPLSIGFPQQWYHPINRQGNVVRIRKGIPDCFSVKGKVRTPIEPQTATVITGLTYQHSLSLFDTSYRGMDRNDKPLPMLISVANLIDQERLFSHAQGGKSRPFRCEEY
jgi:CHASE1-domain containing sensor protein